MRGRKDGGGVKLCGQAKFLGQAASRIVANDPCLLLLKSSMKLYPLECKVDLVTHLKQEEYMKVIKCHFAPRLHYEERLALGYSSYLFLVCSKGRNLLCCGCPHDRELWEASSL